MLNLESWKPNFLPEIEPHRSQMGRDVFFFFFIFQVKATEAKAADSLFIALKFDYRTAQEPTGTGTGSAES